MIIFFLNLRVQSIFLILQADGQILLDEEPIDYSKVSFGYLPEERGLYPKEKIIDQLVYLAELKGMQRSEATKSIDYWLDFLNMTEFRNKNLDNLSKGNQQKIQLISSIAHQPDVIVFDEPFTGLDPVNAKLLESVIKEQIKQNKIVIFSSHQMNYIEQFCDDMIILKNGKIMLSGNIKQIKQSYPQNKLLVESNEAKKIHQTYKEQTILQDSDSIIYKMDNPDEKKKVMQKLIKEFDIRTIGIFEPTLGDIFVEYAGDEHEKAEINQLDQMEKGN